MPEVQRLRLNLTPSMRKQVEHIGTAGDTPRSAILMPETGVLLARHPSRLLQRLSVPTFDEGPQASTVASRPGFFITLALFSIRLLQLVRH